MPRNRRRCLATRPARPGVHAHSAIDSPGSAPCEKSVVDIERRQRHAAHVSRTGRPTTRVHAAPVEGAATLFTPTFIDYLVALHDASPAARAALRGAASETLLKRARHGRPPAPAPERGEHRRLAGPARARRAAEARHRDLGPLLDHVDVHQRAQPRARRASAPTGDLDDDEDSGGHRLIDTVRVRAQPARRREPRALRSSTPSATGSTRSPRASCRSSCTASAASTWTSPTSPSTARPSTRPLLGTALTLFYAGRAQAERGQGIYFYLPKLESRRRGALVSRPLRR